jgi:hypothetical protein
MENPALSSPSNNFSTCSLCKKAVPKSEIFCSNCGYPSHGTADQKAFYKVQRAKKRTALNEAKQSIVWAITILGIMTFLNLVISLVIWINIADNQGGSLETAIGCGIYAILYGGLSIWSYYKPFPAILSGFILYITSILIQAIVEPATLVSGPIWKLLIITAFIKAIVSAKKHVALEKELAK